MPPDARHVVRRDHAARRRKFRRQNHADRDALAVEQPIRETGRGFQRVTERMAEIEQRAFAGLALVTRHDGCLGTAGRRDGVLAGAAAAGDAGVIGFAPCEESGVAEQPVFGDLCIAGAELPRRQCVEHRGVCDNQNGLVKRTDQVLALRRIDPGFPADGRIDLRQQRGRRLHEIEAAAQNRCSKACEIADHTAAQCDHKIVALDLRRDQLLANLRHHAVAFGGLAAPDDDPRRRDARFRQRGFRSRKPVLRDRLVGDDRDPRAGPQRCDAGAELGQHMAPDHDLIGAVAKRDIDDRRTRGCQWNGHEREPSEGRASSCATAGVSRPVKAATQSSTTLSCGTSCESTTRSASS